MDKERRIQYRAAAYKINLYAEAIEELMAAVQSEEVEDDWNIEYAFGTITHYIVSIMKVLDLLCTELSEEGNQK
jgi:hypothetical protein